MQNDDGSNSTRRVYLARFTREQFSTLLSALDWYAEKSRVVEFQEAARALLAQVSEVEPEPVGEHQAIARSSRETAAEGGRDQRLIALAGDLADVLALIECAVNSLDAHEGRGGPELPVFERALKDLGRIHERLDDAAGGAS